MSRKYALKDALDELPDGISGFAGTAIPTAPVIAEPATVDEAIIAQGILSRYLLDFFGAFAGLTPVELLLRIGQHNSALQGMFVTGLKITEGKGGSLDIVTPADGSTVYGCATQYLVKAPSAKSVSGTIDGTAIDFSSDQSPSTGYWFAELPVFNGTHALAVSATFAGAETVSRAASFDVSEFATSPDTGDTISTAARISIDIGQVPVSSARAVLESDAGTVLDLGTLASVGGSLLGTALNLQGWAGLLCQLTFTVVVSGREHRVNRLFSFE